MGSWVEGMIIATYEETLRRLVLHDERCIQSTLGIHLNNEAAGLDPRTQALVRLGGLVAMGAAPGSYHWAAEAALDAGATPRGRCRHPDRGGADQRARPRDLRHSRGCRVARLRPRRGVRGGSTGTRAGDIPARQPFHAARRDRWRALVYRAANTDRPLPQGLASRDLRHRTSP